MRDNITVLVIGATGKVGREVVARLATRNTSVVAVTRHVQDTMYEGVKAVCADWHSPERIGSAADGANACFLITPVRP